MYELLDFIRNIFPYVVAILMIWLFFNAKDLKFKEDENDSILHEYYLKYRLPGDEKYCIAHVDEFDEIYKRTDDFLLYDFRSGNTLDSKTSHNILYSGKIEVMLGLGDNVQIWYKP